MPLEIISHEMEPRLKTLLFALAIIAKMSATEGNILEEIFRDYKIVPEIISEAPPELAKVCYGNVSVTTGTKITSEQSQQTPCVKWTAVENVLYSLILIDPDIPREVPAKEIIHWLVVNIPENDIDKGVTLFEYIGCTPLKGNPAHRYVFLVYKQDQRLLPDIFGELTDDKRGKMSLRMRTTLKEIKEKFQLENVVAGNFHSTIYDENVPRFWNATFEKYA